MPKPLIVPGPNPTLDTEEEPQLSSGWTLSYTDNRSYLMCRTGFYLSVGSTSVHILNPTQVDTQFYIPVRNLISQILSYGFYCLELS